MDLVIAPPPSFAINKQRYQRTDSKTVQDQDRPKPPEITLKDLLGQFWIDIYGKEVQSASTYSYTWVADQVGHVCIGIVLSFGLAIFASYLLPPHSEEVTLRHGIAGLILVASIVSFWEYRAYWSSMAGATHIFRLRRKLLGPIDSGRTSFAAGIGTELAFRKAKVRYLTFNSLLEFAAHQPEFGDDAGPPDINYWRGSETQVVRPWSSYWCARSTGKCRQISGDSWITSSRTWRRSLRSASQSR